MNTVRSFARASEPFNTRQTQQTSHESYRIGDESELEYLLGDSEESFWLEHALLSPGWSLPPSSLVPLISDRPLSQHTQMSLKSVFPDTPAGLLQTNEILTIQLQSYVAAEDQAIIQTALDTSRQHDPQTAAPEMALKFHKDPWYEIDESLLLEGLPEVTPHHRLLPQTPMIQPGQFGFWSDFNAGAYADQKASPVPINPRLSVVGDSTEILQYPTVSSLNAQVVQMLDSYSGQLPPRVGVVYEIMPEHIDGYYTFDQSSLLADPDGTMDGASIFSPFSGENHRAGVQARFLDGQWAVMASGFYSESNLATTFVPSPFFDWSRGAEVAIQARMTSRWKTTLRLSEIESQMTDLQGGENWMPPKKQSNSTASLWNRINILQDEDQTLAIGLGTRLVNSHKSSYANSMILPGYSRWDLGLFYRSGGLEARLYIENILDRGYYQDTSWLLSDPDSPLSIEAQLQLRY